VTEVQTRTVEVAPDGAVAPHPAERTWEERDERMTVIRPADRRPHVDVRELWRYRELFGALVWRDISVRYKQTALGAAWAILQPFLLMVVMTIVFGKFAQFPTDNVPYPIFSYSGLLPWTFFAAALAGAGASVVSNVALVTKVYFPRLILPVSAALVPLVDFALALTVLFGMMVYFDVDFAVTMLTAPLFLVLAAATAIGVGLFLAALNVRYRDVPYAVPFLVQIWFWLSPVAYARVGLEEHWQWVYAVNPMSGVLDGFRWAMLGTSAPDPAQFALSVAVALVLFAGGLAFFRSSEPRFADTI
jgi:lipopolysaccharide transport system permease protein